MTFISFISETGPVIWIEFFSSILIDNLPFKNSISTLFSVNPFIFPATAVAHAAVPQAFVLPAPLSHTFILIKFLLITDAKVTFIFSGNNSWFSINGPICFKSYL